MVQPSGSQQSIQIDGDKEMITLFCDLREVVRLELDKARASLRHKLLHPRSVIAAHFYGIGFAFFWWGVFICASAAIVLVRPYISSMLNSAILPIAPVVNVIVSFVVVLIWTLYWVPLYAIVKERARWPAFSRLAFTMLIQPAMFLLPLYLLDSNRHIDGFAQEYLIGVALNLLLLVVVYILIFMLSSFLFRSIFFIVTSSYLPHWLKNVIPAREELLKVCLEQARSNLSQYSKEQLRRIDRIAEQRIAHATAQLQPLSLFSGLISALAVLALVLSATQVSQALDLALAPMTTMPTVAPSALTITGSTVAVITLLGIVALGIFYVISVYVELNILEFIGTACKLRLEDQPAAALPVSTAPRPAARRGWGRLLGALSLGTLAGVIVAHLLSRARKPGP